MSDPEDKWGSIEIRFHALIDELSAVKDRVARFERTDAGLKEQLRQSRDDLQLVHNRLIAKSCAFEDAREQIDENESVIEKLQSTIQHWRQEVGKKESRINYLEYKRLESLKDAEKWRDLQRRIDALWDNLRKHGGSRAAVVSHSNLRSLLNEEEK